MMESIRSMLIGTSGLAAGAVIALVLALSRGYADADEPRARRTVRIAVLLVAVQAGHFAEELATGFHRRFPEMLGLSPWSDGFFISFNLFWIAVWAIGIAGLAKHRRAALFPLWFLGITGAVNGIAHPLLAIRAGGYFPGLYTSPYVGVMGAMLLAGLFAITKPAVPAMGRA